MTGLWERISSYLNGFEGRICDILPQTLDKGFPAAGVFSRAEGKERCYYDGSVCLRIPFEVRLRINAFTVRSKSEGLNSLIGLMEYIRSTPLWDTVEGGQIRGVRVNGIPYRCSEFSDGSEEYCLRFYVDMKSVCGGRYE